MTPIPSHSQDSGNIQVVIQRQALIVVRVDGDFGNEGWRCEELYFDPARSHEVVGSSEAGAQQRNESGRKCAHGSASMEWRCADSTVGGGQWQ
jgi:hypothetical protein